MLAESVEGTTLHDRIEALAHLAEQLNAVEIAEYEGYDGEEDEEENSVDTTGGAHQSVSTEGAGVVDDTQARSQTAITKEERQLIRDRRRAVLALAQAVEAEASEISRAALQLEQATSLTRSERGAPAAGGKKQHQQQPAAPSPTQQQHQQQTPTTADQVGESADPTPAASTARGQSDHHAGPEAHAAASAPAASSTAAAPTTSGGTSATTTTATPHAAVADGSSEAATAVSSNADEGQKGGSAAPIVGADEATRVLAHAVRALPHPAIRALMLTNLACVEKRRGRAKVALLHLERVVECEGGEDFAPASTLLNLSATLMSLGEAARAAEFAKRAVAALGGLAGPGRSTRRGGTAASPELALSDADLSRRPFAFYNWAVALRECGDEGTARVAIEEAVAAVAVVRHFADVDAGQGAKAGDTAPPPPPLPPTLVARIDSLAEELGVATAADNRSPNGNTSSTHHVKFDSSNNGASAYRGASSGSKTASRLHDAVTTGRKHAATPSVSTPAASAASQHPSRRAVSTTPGPSGASGVSKKQQQSSVPWYKQFGSVDRSPTVMRNMMGALYKPTPTTAGSRAAWDSNTHVQVANRHRNDSAFSYYEFGNISTEGLSTASNTGGGAGSPTISSSNTHGAGRPSAGDMADARAALLMLHHHRYAETVRQARVERERAGLPALPSNAEEGSNSMTVPVDVSSISTSHHATRGGAASPYFFSTETAYGGAYPPLATSEGVAEAARRRWVPRQLIRLAEELRFRETCRRVAIVKARATDARRLRVLMQRHRQHALELADRVEIEIEERRERAAVQRQVVERRALAEEALGLAAVEGAARRVIMEATIAAALPTLVPLAERLQLAAAEESRRYAFVAQAEWERALILKESARVAAALGAHDALEPVWVRGLAAAVSVWALEAALGVPPVEGLELVPPRLRSSTFVLSRHSLLGRTLPPPAAGGAPRRSTSAMPTTSGASQ